MSQTKQPTNTGALTTLVMVFFFWGFIAASNSIFIPFCKTHFNLNNFESQLIGSAFYGAYFIGSLILFIFSNVLGKDLLNKIGYKKGIIYGLLISVVGALLIIPSANANSFPAILASFFVVALGFSLQQTAAQARIRLSARRTHRASDRGQQPRRRGAQSSTQPAGPVRRCLGVRAQGRTARVGDQPRQGCLRAHRPGTRRQRHAIPRVGNGGSCDDPDEGERARSDDGRTSREPSDRRLEASRARGVSLRGRGCVTRVVDAPRDGLGAGLLPRRVDACHHRRGRERNLHHRSNGEGVGGRGPRGLDR